MKKSVIWQDGKVKEPKEIQKMYSCFAVVAHIALQPAHLSSARSFIISSVVGVVKPSGQKSREQFCAYLQAVFQDLSFVVWMELFVREKI